MILRIKYDNAKIGEIPYPDEGVEKWGGSHLTDLRDEELRVGDSVDCYCQDGKFHQAWCRGYVADVGEDGSSCNVMYYDGCFESGVPTRDKVRLVGRYQIDGVSE